MASTFKTFADVALAFDALAARWLPPIWPRIGAMMPQKDGGPGVFLPKGKRRR